MEMSWDIDTSCSSCLIAGEVLKRKELDIDSLNPREIEVINSLQYSFLGIRQEEAGILVEIDSGRGW